MENISLRLKSLRTQKDLSIQQVCQMIDVPISTYREWEGGRQILGEPYVRIAQAFEVTLYHLLTGESSKTQNSMDLIEKIELDLKQLKRNLSSLD